MKTYFRYPKIVGLTNLALNEFNTTPKSDDLAWLNYILQNQFNDPIKTVAPYRIRPWSQVFKIVSKHNNNYFFKAPDREFILESQIIELIQNLGCKFTTGFIARNTKTGAFLMQAFEGETLRIKLRQQIIESLIESSVDIIGKFQNFTKPNISQFKQLGIPNWSAETIMINCAKTINEDQFLQHTTLSKLELIAFKSLFTPIEHLLSILELHDNGLAIDHGDFQDNNIFISKGESIIMDWADASLTIPSFTIATYCHSLLLAHPNLNGKPKLIKDILANYYRHLLGIQYTNVNSNHISTIHNLYPLICILKVSRLYNLNNIKTASYTTTIIDYWIRIVISFARFYQNESLRNKII